MSDKPKKLSTQAYKGVRDFYPEDMWVQAYIFEIWSIVAESFGYERYDASVLEPAELFRVKSGEEIINEQTYTFTDRGDREVTLRPEMTPSVARMVIAKKRELTFPLRWYSIPNLFRYERPQRGRLREHWQLNCDLFGVSGTDADIEMILLADAVMRGFGATQKDYTIHVNHMGALVAALKAAGVPEDLFNDARRLLDQLEKSDAARSKLEELLGGDIETLLKRVENTEEFETLKAVVKTLKDLGVENIVIDPAIVRGQDYYTGIVFEVFDVNTENNRSMFGGGRYDELMELFGGEQTPATGFGMGDVTMHDFLVSHNLLPEMPAKTDLFIATLDPSLIGEAQKLAEELRSDGINVSVNLTSKKIGDQIKMAEKQHIPHVVVFGDDEKASGRYVIKELASGTKTEVSASDIVSFITNQDNQKE